MKVLVCVCLTLLVFLFITTVGSSPTPSPTTASNVTNADSCSSHKDCDSCVTASNAKCVFCDSGNVKACRSVLSKGLFDIGKVCGSLFQASWATCSVNLMALIIGMSVVGGILLISCCICCCCCCGKSARTKLRWMREDQANQSRDEQRRADHAERRAERQAKNNEIRQKYGLFKDGNGYKKFQNE